MVKASPPLLPLPLGPAVAAYVASAGAQRGGGGLPPFLLPSLPPQTEPLYPRGGGDRSGCGTLFVGTDLSLLNIVRISVLFGSAAILTPLAG